MHSIAFRTGVCSLVLMVLTIVSVELAAEGWGVDRATRAVQVSLRIGTFFLWIGAVAGFVLYPQAWRLYRAQSSSMNPERRHLWFLILVFGLPAAGYAAHIYLRRSRQGP